MLTRKKIGMINKGLTLLLWAFAFFLIGRSGFWYLAAGMLALHSVELFVTGYNRGIRAGYSAVQTIGMVLVFGFTWWLYLEP